MQTMINSPNKYVIMRDVILGCVIMAPEMLVFTEYFLRDRAKREGIETKPVTKIQSLVLKVSMNQLFSNGG